MKVSHLQKQSINVILSCDFRMCAQPKGLLIERTAGVLSPLYLLAVQSKASAQFMSLSLSFLNCKLGLM